MASLVSPRAEHSSHTVSYPTANHLPRLSARCLGRRRFYSPHNSHRAGLEIDVTRPKHFGRWGSSQLSYPCRQAPDQVGLTGAGRNQGWGTWAVHRPRNPSAYRTPPAGAVQPAFCAGGRYLTVAQCQGTQSGTLSAGFSGGASGSFVSSSRHRAFAQHGLPASFTEQPLKH